MRDNAAGIAMLWAQALFQAELSLGSLSKTTDEPLRKVGYGLISILMRPLAAELALKALYIQESGELPRRFGHNLETLFAALEPDTQTQVEGLFEKLRQVVTTAGPSREPPDSLRELLCSHSDHPRQWHYPYEVNSDMSTDIGDLIFVITAAQLVFTSLGGVWRPDDVRSKAPVSSSGLGSRNLAG